MDDRRTDIQAFWKEVGEAIRTSELLEFSRCLGIWRLGRRSYAVKIR
jgi:hypothetical protein